MSKGRLKSGSFGWYVPHQGGGRGSRGIYTNVPSSVVLRYAMLRGGVKKKLVLLGGGDHWGGGGFEARPRLSAKKVQVFFFFAFIRFRTLQNV